MLINEQNSAQIAQRIGAILHKNVNLMNADGKIVASTDPARIGTLHQAAKDLIARDVPEVDVYCGDNITGSKEGINVPIYIDGHTVGVIGVTGNPDELRDISLVIGEMAGILFSEAAQSTQKERERRRRRYYWEDVLFNPHTQENEAFVHRGEELGIFVQRIHSVAQVYLPENIPEAKRVQMDDKLIVSLHAALDAQVFLYHHHIGEKITLFFSRDPDAALLAKLQHAIDGVQKQWALPVYCGVSGGCRSYIHLSQTYQQAEKALDVASRSRRTQVCVYESLALEILLDQIPSSARAAYVQHVLGPVPPEERKEFVSFLNTYFACEGSIQKIAAELFIHKNTVQYKLGKIAEHTGYDPRNLSDATILRLCTRLYAML